MQCQEEDWDVDTFAKLQQECQQRILMQVLISSVARCINANIFSDISKFINSYEDLAEVEIKQSQDLGQLKSKITDLVWGCIVEIVGVEKESNNVGLIIDFHERLIYFFDINCRNIEYYTKLKSELEVNYNSFEVRSVCHFVHRAESNGQKSSNRAYYRQVLTILIWGISKLYDNEGLWYLFAEKIIYHPDFKSYNGKNYCLYMNYMKMESFVNCHSKEECFRVREIIRECAKRGVEIEDLMYRISCSCRNSLSAIERRFIEEKYIKDCTAEFFTQVSQDIARKLDNIVARLSGFIEQIQTMTEIPLLFEETTSFKVMKQCTVLMTKYQHEQFIFDLKGHCLMALLRECETLNDEIEFINEVNKMLRQWFVAIASEDKECKIRVIDTWNKFMSLYHSAYSNVGNQDASFILSLQCTSIDEFQTLKEKALLLDTEKPLHLIPNNLEEHIKHFQAPVQARTHRDGSRKTLTFEGEFIRLDCVCKRIAENNSDKIYQINIIANQLIYINADLQTPGINIVLVSPHIHIGSPHYIDVSGNHCQMQHNESAEHGKNLGDDGYAGEPGEPGEDGGNVYICAEQMSNSQDLEIISNGGDGGNGQNGGNGADGKDGEDGKEISQCDLDSMYPDGADIAAFVIQEIFAVVYAVIDIFREPHHEFIKDGCKVIYCNYSAGIHTNIFALFGYPKQQSYCIHYGGEGTPGTKGGMGGCGGKGGDGGRAGNIDVNCKYHQIVLRRVNGKSGKKGKDGIGGSGGLNGRKGFDTARLTPSQYHNARRYGPARLKLRYVDYKNSDENTAYCPGQSRNCGSNRYAKIEVVSTQREGKERACGERVEKNKARQNVQRRSADQLKKSTLISKNIIDKTFYSILQTNHISELQRIDVGIMHDALAERKPKQHHRADVSYKIEKSDTLSKNEHHNALLLPLVDIGKKGSLVAKEHIEQFGCRMLDEILVFGVHLNGKLSYADDKHSIVIEEAKIIKRHLEKDVIGDLQELKALASQLKQLKEKVDNRISKRTWLRMLKDAAKRDQCLDKEVSKTIEEIYEIVLMKYRFVSLTHLAEETNKTVVELIKNNAKGRGWKNFISVLKNKLIHLNFNGIKDVLNAISFDVVDTCFNQVKSNIEKNLFDLCKLVISDENTLIVHEVQLNKEIGWLEKTTDYEVSPKESEISNEVGRNAEVESKVERPTGAENPVNRNITGIERLYETGKSTQEPKSLGKMHRRIIHDHLRQNSKEESLDHARYDPYIKSLEQLKNLDSEIAHLLWDTIMLQIFLNGIHLSRELFDLLISKITGVSDSQTLKMFCWIVSTKHMSKWIAEYTVMQSILTGNLDVEFEEHIRKSLHKFKDVKWIPALWTYIFEKDFFQLFNCLNVLKLLQDADYNSDIMHHLSAKNIENWESTLAYYCAYNRLLKLPVNWTPVLAMEAQCYLYELKNVYGEGVYSNLCDALHYSTAIELDDIMMLLRNLYHDYWQPTEILLETVRYKPSAKWQSILTDIFQVEKDRSLPDLIRLMKEDACNSFTSQGLDVSRTQKDMDDELDNVLQTLDTTLEKGNVSNTFENEFIEDWKSNFYSKIAKMTPEEKDKYSAKITEWSNTIRRRVKDLTQSVKEQFLATNICEIFSHVEIGISLVTGFKLRQAQRLAIILLLNSKLRGRLAQVATGEGKTIIIVAFCIMKNLVGEDVDVITSSPVLAERDAEENKNIYDLFGTTVSHNCSDDDEKRIDAYKKNIVYGEIASFQRDLLLQQFYCKNILGKRGFQNILVDEVDSMLLDKAEHVLYLSHSIVDLEALEPLFVYIWTFVHGNEMLGTESELDEVHAALMNAMYGSITKKHFFNCLTCYEKDDSRLEKIWEFLKTTEVIDSKHRIIPVTQIKNNSRCLNLPQDLLSDKEQDVEGMILNYLKNILRQGTSLKVPVFLQEFIDLHLMDWINSAFKARFMDEGVHYIIDINRNDMETGQGVNVVIMDTDTGVAQFNMKWDNALHIFIQLKHSCRTSIETLKAVFISNIGFFKHYEGSIFGLTGTLGSKKERDVLQDMYDVSYVTVPTFRPKRFQHLKDHIYDNEREWLEETVETAIQVAEKRPVLIICEDIKKVEMFEKHINSRRLGHVPIYLYKHSHKKLDIIDNKIEIETGCIIIATNLAGRGTDIKINAKISDLGGLHIILTYIPRNTRISEQAFGRAARKGDKGSGQFCIYDRGDEKIEMPSLLRILMLKSQRNEEEHARLLNLRKHYEQVIQVEESYFNKFQEVYKELEKQWDNELETTKRIVLNACISLWAFWLDLLHKRITSGNEDSGCHWMEFTAKIVKELDPEVTLRKMGIPSQLMMLGTTFIKEGDYSHAIEVLKRLTEQEPYFSDSAHYYIAHCLIKETGLTDEDSKKQFVYHLEKADETLKRKVDVYSELYCIVKSVREFYGTGRTNFSVCDSYERQKTDEICIMETFRGTIRGMLGHTIDIPMLVNVSQDAVVAKRVFESKAILQCARFSDYVNDKLSKLHKGQRLPVMFEELYDKYELYASEIEQRICDLRQRNKEPKAGDFEGILPCREEFWEKLKEKTCISNEECFFLIDMEKLESVLGNRKIVEKVSQIKKNNDVFETIFTNRCEEEAYKPKEHPLKEEGIVPICIFPEKIDDIIENKLTAVNKETSIDPFLKETLECYGAIFECRIAYLNTEKCKSTKLAKYDGIRRENFQEIRGIDKTTADEIYRKVEPFLVDYGLPDLDGINFSQYKKFETEVKNLVEKYYKYREILTNLEQTGTIVLGSIQSEPHKLLWEDLIDLKIVIPVKVKSDVTKETAQIFINAEKCSLERTYNYVSYFLKFEDMSSLASSLHEWKAGIYKYDRINSELKDIREILEKKILKNASEELALLSARGFDQIITIQEQNLSWSAVFKIAGIFAIGIVQIVLGAVLEVFPLMPGMCVAGGLTSEGICDIMFAVESAISGNCSMKEYSRHKVISLAITILTCGIGAYFVRKAKYSRFGCKFLGQQVPKAIGRDLLKEATSKSITKQVSKIVGKKLIQATAVRVATAGVDKLVETMLQGKLKEICNSIICIFKPKGGNSSLKDLVRSYCEKYGSDRTHKKVLKVCTEIMKSQDSKIITGTIKVLEAISNGMDNALQMIKKEGMIASDPLLLISSILATCMKYQPYVTALLQLKKTCKQFVKRLPNDLKRNLELINCQNKSYDVSEHKENEILADLEDTLAQRMDEILTKQFIRPVLNRHAREFITNFGKGVKKTYRNVTKRQHLLLFQIAQRSHERARMGMYANVTDPAGYAQIIPERGNLMGFQRSQAFSRIATVQRSISLCGRDVGMVLPEICSPSNGLPHAQPAVQNYHKDIFETTEHNARSLRVAKCYGEGSLKSKNTNLPDAISEIINEKIDRNEVSHDVENRDCVMEKITMVSYEHNSHKVETLSKVSHSVILN